ncbi:sensor histidine kinase [Sinomonas sp. G460-2]|uniref:sensor histidine kinase n=1 Tax=Sinomonas sp. G460-2 TaxID=3393464 RepID=UPI0039EFE8F6
MTLFAAAGAILLLMTYVLLAQSLSRIPATSPTTSPSLDPTFAATCSTATDQNLIEKCKLAYEQGKQAGVIDQRTATLSQLLGFSMLALILTIVAAAILGWFMAGRVLRPVRLLTDAARRASQENLAERLALTGPHDEFKELADTFDQMLTRLDTAFANQKRFIADASHELRTPLAVMRTAIDVTLAKTEPTRDQLKAMAEDVRDGVDRSEALIRALLVLARSEAGVDVSEPVNLELIAENAVDDARPHILRAGLTLDTEFDHAPVLGDPVLLERLTANLLDNATRHNVEGGWIRLSTSVSGSGVILAISNSGEKIPPDEVPGLFEPFRRLATRTGSAARTSSQQGFGLGLAIARSIASAHQGRLEAESRPSGGLSVTLRLPMASPKPALPRPGNLEG